VLSKPPTFVQTVLDVNLPAERDQIATKEHPEFIRLRGEAARLIRSAPSGGAPTADEAARAAA
jgi:NitT/TauT family transport system ATP-binding protein